MQNCKSNINYSRENFNRKKNNKCCNRYVIRKQLKKKKCFLPT